ncbi:type VI secretion system baseplate subunit TssE [Shinella oryzae]|jgi:type VI secretion system protein ImpF|uniref:type VI secretion system baseplate subunit TssE n=1 Tax=Shinella TaxID=323620 RepID=UPI001FF2F94E|nr:type VI secretion system baseplate subunit TssE [Shinella oryzae]MDP9592330.1 type VI secretion system protein ImpF [Shinella zoogloeoides]UPA26896.1 type VI secretion system baseplate subunit TssE [Shinella oryzae]
MLREYVPELPDHLQTSVFDRLIDPSPDLSNDPLESAAQRFSRLKEIFRRDLEAILNTRRWVHTTPKPLGELSDSLLNYGVSDFIGASVITTGERERMALAIEETIARTEPRFHDVHVEVLEPADGIERVLHMRICAVVTLSEGARPLTFETALDPSTRHFSVSEQNRR